MTMQDDGRAALAQNLRRVREKIAQTAERVRRDPAGITLVAVTKTVPAELVASAFQLGLTRFGENRVQEAASKIPCLRGLLDRHSDVEWHLIGHLQTNKVRAAVGLFDLCQSVDSVRVAMHLSDEANRAGRVLPVLLEVNVAREAGKFGLTAEELEDAAAAIATLPGLRIEGLMTVAPLAADPNDVRPVFRALREWRDALRQRVPRVNWRHLSMGMSDDYGVAIEEGATILRLGRAIFGARR